MFNNYLVDIDKYLALETSLQDFFLSIVNYKNPVDCPYYNTTFSNGVPFMDGDPIFSARKKNNGQVIKVVLDEDTDSISEFDNEVEGYSIHIIVANVSALESIKEKVMHWYAR
ncbi:hypothetical protein [Pantoea sp. A4]|uniref:hypothetical protein n=1 Tax=Pantoea sp. A4 TaxID=1225184 RepID=UPI000374495D|nr:hypothetical protein [Pantoea sp. A4]